MFRIHKILQSKFSCEHTPDQLCIPKTVPPPQFRHNSEINPDAAQHNYDGYRHIWLAHHKVILSCMAKLGYIRDSHSLKYAFSSFALEYLQTCVTRVTVRQCMWFTRLWFVQLLINSLRSKVLTDQIMLP